MEKICSRCKQTKSLEDFAKKNCWCKECHRSHRKETGLNLYAHRKDYLTEWQKKFRQTVHAKEYERDFRSKYNCTFDGTVTKIFTAAKVRARKANRTIDIDREWVVDHLTPMKCEATGVDLVLEIDPSVAHTAMRPSIDRIDNSKGYTKDNCRIVCVMYNNGKSEYTDEDFLKMALSFVALRQKTTGQSENEE